ncbi:hypothetical protein DVT68_17050 [Dyella solisilvae]|uniref:Uncharacterized protein n=1 Tax=Dyella solisilvae TaxID=1920168 RepID=A0A370K602_9GAMM|nr:hypothetical protein DVT68_17050 [Dyella solisilvae]
MPAAISRISSVAVSAAILPIERNIGCPAAMTAGAGRLRGDIGVDTAGWFIQRSRACSMVCLPARRV